LFIIPVVFGLALGATAINAYIQTPLIVLKTSEQLITEATGIGGIAISPQNKQLYAADRKGVVFPYDQDPMTFQVALPKTDGAFAFGTQGHIYYLDSPNRIRVADPSSGITFATFPVPRPMSLGVLKKGEVVIAAPARGHLFHIYNQIGMLLRSFGEIKQFNMTDKEQNIHLNQGKILVSPSDEIYYVFKYAPFVQKFSSQGKLIAEFRVEGTAINLQQAAMQRGLSKRQTGQIGGIVIITSADLDPETGRLWLCMNGSSQSGVVYEYDSSGRKLNEYAFVFTGSSTPVIITDATDIAVRSPSIYLMTSGGQVYKFDINNRLSSNLIPSVYNIVRKNDWGLAVRTLFSPAKKDLALGLTSQLPCSPTVEIPACTYDCPPELTPETINCKKILEDSLSALPKVAPAGCNFHTHGCTANVTLCDTSGNRTSHTTGQKNCTQPPPPPDNDGDGYSTNQGDCDDFNASVYPGAYIYCTTEDKNCNGMMDIDEFSCDPNSPIVIDVDGNGFDLTNPANGVDFDLNSDGTPEHLSWTSTGSDDAWLALDRNGNEVIDDGAELFGNFTPQPNPPLGEERNGFLALAEYDKQANGGNGDGQIDWRDSIFPLLGLWRDTNHNGISEQSELHSLVNLGVVILDLDYKRSKRVDEHGNRYKYRAKVKDVHGAQVGRWAWDVYLVKQ
jgi:hypothetical protein